MMLTDIRFSPTEERILGKLSDGMSHTRTELMTCINDDMADPQVLNNHISRIRKKLATYGQTIICELISRRIGYRHVRLIK